MKIRILIATLLFSSLAFAQEDRSDSGAKNSERLLLSSGPEISKMCEKFRRPELHEISFICQARRSSEPSLDDKAPVQDALGWSGPFSSVDLNQSSNRLANLAAGRFGPQTYFTSLIVTQHSMDDGGFYYTAHPLVFKLGFFDRLERSFDLDSQIWSLVEQNTKTAQAGSDEWGNYLTSLSTKRAQDAIDQEKQRQYLASPEFKANQAAQSIHACRAQMIFANGIIEQERRVQKISGVINVVNLHNAGTIITLCQDKIAAEWASYKAAGGTEKSIDELLQRYPKQ